MSDKISLKLSFPVFIVAVLFLLPIIVVAYSAFLPWGDNATHVLQNTLPNYIENSLFLMIGVGFLTFFIGTVTAWLVNFYSFPGKKIFTVALLFPLAIPTYVDAFVYGHIFDYAGPLQSYLRDFFNWQKDDYSFFEIRSIGGAIFVMSMALYPYVYLLCYVAFKKSADLILVSKSLGISGFEMFYKVAIPAIRPAIIAGISLALMESLSDFGTVQHFAVDSFTTAIYRSWFGMGDYHLAARLSAFLMFFIFILVFLEKASRRQAGYQSIDTLQNNHITGFKLTKRQSFAASLLCFIPILFGALLPIYQLLVWLFESYTLTFDARFMSYTLNSLKLSFTTAFITVFLSVLFAYILRFGKNKYLSYLIKFSSMGYAIPGSVVAVGILVLLGTTDKFLDQYFDTGLLLSGTMVALVFAYVFRFFVISLNSIESGLEKINKEVDWSAKILGKNSWITLIKVHTPIIWTSIATAFLMVFVESIKELPATLIIRPFNFETLATYTYQLASDERLADSSGPALMIILVGLIPVAILTKIFLKR